jgi:hypothetical protein
VVPGQPKPSWLQGPMKTKQKQKDWSADHVDSAYPESSRPHVQPQQHK